MSRDDNTDLPLLQIATQAESNVPVLHWQLGEQPCAGMPVPAASHGAAGSVAAIDDVILVDLNDSSDDEGGLLLNFHSKKSSVPLTMNTLESHRKGFNKAFEIENKKIKLVYLLLSQVRSGCRVIDAMNKMHRKKQLQTNSNILVSHCTTDAIGQALIQLSKSLANEAPTLRGNFNYFLIVIRQDFRNFTTYVNSFLLNRHLF